jgi:hypothetical protein
MDDIQENNQFRNSRVQEIIHNMNLANDNDPSSLDPSIVNSLGLSSKSSGNSNIHSNSLESSKGSTNGISLSSGSTNGISLSYGSTNGISLEDAGQELASFTPLPLFSERKPDAPVKPSASPFSYFAMERNDSNLGNSYYHAYSDKSKMGNIPSYSMDRIRNSGANSSSSSNEGWNNDKILEKLNKMIHLLEEQQHEPTKHVTEEFILYTFLGVFIIFIVDSFSKNGKYIR